MIDFKPYLNFFNSSLIGVSFCGLAQMASFLLYLSDVEEGGETMFPFEVSLSRFSISSFWRYSVKA